jgi:hypothetical protein
MLNQHKHMSTTHITPLTECTISKLPSYVGMYPVQRNPEILNTHVKNNYGNIIEVPQTDIQSLVTTWFTHVPTGLHITNPLTGDTATIPISNLRYTIKGRTTYELVTSGVTTLGQWSDTSVDKDIHMTSQDVIDMIVKSLMDDDECQIGLTISYAPTGEQKELECNKTLVQWQKQLTHTDISNLQCKLVVQGVRMELNLFKQAVNYTFNIDILLGNTGLIVNSNSLECLRVNWAMEVKFKRQLIIPVVTTATVSMYPVDTDSTILDVHDKGFVEISKTDIPSLITAWFTNIPTGLHITHPQTKETVVCPITNLRYTIEGQITFEMETCHDVSPGKWRNLTVDDTVYMTPQQGIDIVVKELMIDHKNQEDEGFHVGLLISYTPTDEQKKLDCNNTLLRWKVESRAAYIRTFPCKIVSDNHPMKVNLFKQIVDVNCTFDIDIDSGITVCATWDIGVSFKPSPVSSVNTSTNTTMYPLQRHPTPPNVYSSTRLNLHKPNVTIDEEDIEPLITSWFTNVPTMLHITDTLTEQSLTVPIESIRYTIEPSCPESSFEMETSHIEKPGQWLNVSKSEDRYMSRQKAINMVTSSWLDNMDGYGGCSIDLRMFTTEESLHTNPTLIQWLKEQTKMEHIRNSKTSTSEEKASAANGRWKCKVSTGGDSVPMDVNLFPNPCAYEVDFEIDTYNDDIPECICASWDVRVKVIKENDNDSDETSLHRLEAKDGIDDSEDEEDDNEEEEEDDEKLEIVISNQEDVQHYHSLSNHSHPVKAKDDEEEDEEEDDT